MNALDTNKAIARRVADGRIVEHWNNFDQLGILRQMGVIPAG
jgi:predicted ester cyclase